MKGFHSVYGADHEAGGALVCSADLSKALGGLGSGDGGGCSCCISLPHM